MVSGMIAAEPATGEAQLAVRRLPITEKPNPCGMPATVIVSVGAALSR